MPIKIICGILLFELCGLMGLSADSKDLMIGKNDLKIATGDGVTVLILVEPFRVSDHGGTFESYSWWGADETPPKTYMRAIKVWIGKSAQIVPRSAYDYLGSPNQAELVIDSNKKLILKVRGGDAGTGYVATFIFKNGVLTERIVRSGEFPDEVWEKNSYRNFLTR